MPAARTIRRTVAAISTTILLAAQVGHGAEVVFINPNGGNWSVPGNWSTGTVPQPGDDVLVDGLGPNWFPFVNLDTDATVSTLRVLAGKRLYMQDGFALTLTGPSLTNAGEIEMQSAAAPVSLLLSGGNELSVSGGGRIVMQGGARIVGAGAGTSKLINVDNLIRGSGAIGGDSIGIVNGAAGIIDARPGAAFGIDLDPAPAHGMVNRGVAQAGGGGILRLSGAGGGEFDNAGGTMRALDGSQVHLVAGAVVSGGSLASSGSGVVRIPDLQRVTLRDVTNAGHLALNPSATLTLAGNLVNTGSITAAGDLAGFRPTTLLVPAGTEATLSGGGTVHLDDAYVRGRLINLDNVIEGRATIGGFTEGMVNHGTIRSVQPMTGMTIYSHPTVPMRNAGTIAVANGAAITLTGQNGRVFLNDGGRIESNPLHGGWVVLDSGATVVGGTMGPGNFGVLPSNNGRVENITLGGVFWISGGLTLAGTIHNAGQFLTEGGLSVDGTVTLLGDGYVTAEVNGRIGGSGTLVNVSNQIIGVGRLGNNAIAIENRAGGLIASRTGFQSSTFVVDPAPDGGLINHGMLRAAGGTLVLSGAGGGSFDSAAGSIEILGGATLSTTAGAVLLAGPITSAGTFAHDAMATVGAVDGTGTVVLAAGATLSAARVRQARLAVGAGGSVTVRENGTHGATSRLGALDLAGAPGTWLGTFDLNDNALVIDYPGASPVATVRSQVQAAHAAGAWTGAGITSAAARATAGTEHPTAVGYAEAAALFATFPAPFHGEMIDATSLLLAHVPSGDADLSGTVNLADFNRLAENFGQSNRFWHQGDYNYDGQVNLSDFNLLAENFGISARGPRVTPADWAALASAVPEPAGLAVLLAGLAEVFRRRRGAVPRPVRAVSEAARERRGLLSTPPTTGQARAGRA